MTQNIRKSLLAIQIVTAFLAILIFAAGLFVSRSRTRSEGMPTKSSELKFEESMRSSIGKPYTEERHYKVMELMRTADEVIAASNESLTGASELVRNLGGILALSALTSIVLLVRNPRSSKQDENDNLP
jgi:hypothetical protein